MPVSEDSVREQLKQVIDPELFINIVDLGLVYEITVQPWTGTPASNDGASADSHSDEPAVDGNAPAVEKVAGVDIQDSVGTPQPSETTDSASVPATPTTDTEGTGASGVEAELDESNNSEDPVHVQIEMTLTSPMCPAGPQLVAECKKFAGELPQVAQVDVKVVMEPQWTPDRMTEDARDQLGIF